MGHLQYSLAKHGAVEPCLVTMAKFFQPLRFHVLYWETGGGDFPEICETCHGVSKAWHWRMDNLQSCLRVCGKEGHGFRREVETFTCLGPKMCISSLAIRGSTELLARFWLRRVSPCFGRLRWCPKGM